MPEEDLHATQEDHAEEALPGISGVTTAGAAFVRTTNVLGQPRAISLISYSAAQRAREIGIRLALGARKGEVLWLVVGQGMMLARLGLVAGIVGALALTRYLARLLFGVKAAMAALKYE